MTTTTALSYSIGATHFQSVFDHGVINKIVFHKRSFGDLSDEDTPGPIPNPAVKLVSADGTWGVAPWESKSLPRDLFLFGFHDQAK